MAHVQHSSRGFDRERTGTKRDSARDRHDRRGREDRRDR
jgi:hypothetical protein